MRRTGFPGVVVLLLAVVLLLTATRGWTQAKPPVSVALVAAMSGGSALSGDAIKRGLTVAIDEINARGGLLGGRKVELVIRDEEGNPSKGVTAARDVIERERAVAVFGGLHSPVGLAMLPVFHELRVPYVGTWAAATAITRNGRTPNFMFRVSANDDIVDHFLAKHVTEKLGKRKPGVILENTPWGASNQEGLTKWFAKLGAQPVGFEKFNWNDSDMSAQLLRLKNGGADAIVMVANAPEGAQVVKSRAKIRDALENLGEHRGLIKTYRRPFTPEEHDALTENDYILVTWQGGKIVPVAMK